jgi:hypothetical protein
MMNQEKNFRLIFELLRYIAMVPFGHESLYEIEAPISHEVLENIITERLERYSTF